MDPLRWLSERWAEIQALPSRLEELERRALERYRDRSLPDSDRRAAFGIWEDARDDRVEVTRLLRDRLRVAAGGLAGLGALPVIIVVGVSAAVVAGALAAVFRRATTYEQELALIGAGAATAEDVRRLRASSAPSGIASALREAGSLARVLLLGAAGAAAWKLSAPWRQSS